MVDVHYPVTTVNLILVGRGAGTTASLCVDAHGLPGRRSVVSGDVGWSLAWPTQIKLISRQSWLARRRRDPTQTTQD